MEQQYVTTLQLLLLFVITGYLSLCDASCENYNQMEGEDIYLECEVSRINVSIWKKDNKTLLVGEKIYRNIPGLEVWKNYTLQLTGVTFTNEGYYECMEDRNVIKSYCVSIYKMQTVVILMNGKIVETPIYASSKQTITLQCVAYGCRPRVNLVWKLNLVEINEESANVVVSHNASERGNDTYDIFSTFRFLVEDDVSNITCFISEEIFNKRGYSLSVIEVHGRHHRILVGGLIVTLFICGMIMFVLRQLCKGTQRELLVNMSEIVRIRSTEASLEMREPQHEDFENHSNHEENLLVQRRNQLFEWNKAKTMVLLPSKGNLMQYWLAEYEFPEHHKALLEDAYHFMDLASQLDTSITHEHLVKLLGVSINEIRSYTYHEYVTGGTLRNYLLSMFASDELASGPHGFQTSNAITLCMISRDLSSALIYLHKRGYVHPGISARKVLLTDQGVSKLYDFLPVQLAKVRVESLLKKDDPPLPWMAPEVLFLDQYCMSSDVWSFAVLLWELYSFGATPYKEMTSDEVERCIRQCKYLDCPISCPGSVYGIMISSWEKDSSKRPSFDKIFSMLDENALFYEDRHTGKTITHNYCALRILLAPLNSQTSSYRYNTAI
ncbi:uncharacterized protein [Apostichopus japonicus]|uniref:uncharacterized protein isoform X3 n=1 Tax=Stichopus japonicus TaxID=307972 RepID=UPI003AB1D411